MKRFPHHWRHKQQHSRRRGRRVFFRFLVVFGLIVALIIGAMGMLAGLLTRWGGGSQSMTLLVWIGGIVIAIALPLMAIRLAIGAFRSIAVPLTEVMEAAEAVSKGDLSVRVTVPSRGEFSGLTKAFNHMVSELALADERRRNLTADVAHELRTPLHIIQGNLEGIIDGVYVPNKEHIESTLEETHLLGRLVEDLRILSQAEAGQLPLRRETVEIGALLRDVETSFSGQAAAAGVVLAVDSGENLRIEADYDRLLQITNNLVSNALRHTHAGGTIALKGTAAEEDAVQIQVIDTGEGILEDELPFIFDRFWRGDKARTHQSGSTGLGLAIAQQLVRAMEGEIKVESRVGDGTSFSLVFPRLMD
ncbi:MAG: ATP-binding protein [Ardenticatenaceae bacterium]|nr:ATP-binding protein [Ardenticatenaceae bacterium]